jgi:hypothetical protein
MPITLRRSLAVLSALACIGCDATRAPNPQAYLFQKGAYQAIYGPDGYMLRLLYDKNGDGLADAVMVYSKGLLQRVESDTDGDGSIDRWEIYDVPGGHIETVAVSRRPVAAPDLWEHYVKGAVAGRELDEDGDGKVDRFEHFADGVLVAVDLDTDRDGRFDRWQQWQGGRLVTETVDVDGDGNADRKLRYGSSGALLGVERIRLPQR